MQIARRLTAARVGQRHKLGSWWHLARRFFEVAVARRVSEFERSLINGWTASDAERGLFYAQPVADQRHSLQAGLKVQSLMPARPDLIRAALFHDVGKRHSGLGIIGRSIASALSKLGVELRGRFAAYLDHDRIGAEELRAMGFESVVVEFAAHHHAGRPDSVAVDDWNCLMQADQPGKTPG